MTGHMIFRKLAQPIHEYIIRNKRGILFSVILLLCTLSADAQMRKYIDDGKMYLLHKNYDAAIKQFSEFATLFPYDGEGFYWMGYTYLQSKNYTKAAEYLNKSMYLAPKFIPVYVAFGQLYFEQEQFESAVPYLLRAVNLDDKNRTVLNTLGMCYYNLEKWELAVKMFSLAIKVDSSFAPAWCNRGAARYNSQNIAVASKVDKELAEQDLNRALQLDPKAPISLRNRAFIRLFQDKLEQAYADISLALKLDSTDAISHYCYAMILFKSKQYKDAMVEFNRSIQMKNNKYDFYFDRGLCRLQLYDSDGARKDFFKAMQLNALCKPLGYYYVAKSFAADKDKQLMLDYLTAAAKAGLFKNNFYFKEIQKDEHFKYYEKDKDYTDLMFKIKFGKI